MRDKIEGLKQNWFVINQLIKRDKQRNLSSTFMGGLWEVINPLINMIVMVLVFSKMFGDGSTGKFPLYVLTGTTIYGLFTSGTTGGLTALVENKNFLIKTQLDKSIYILEKIMLAFRNFLFSLIIYAFVVALYRIPPSSVWLLVIPDVALLLIMMSGIAKLLAIINVKFADITYFYKIFTLFLMYGSALFYRIDRLPETGQHLMLFNPLYVSITIIRECMIDGTCSSVILWFILACYAAFCYILGTICFKKGSEDVVAKI